MANTVSVNKLKSLYGAISKLLTSPLEMDEMLQKIMFEVENFFRPDNWSLLRVDESAKELFFVIVKGIDQNPLKHLRLKMGEGIAGQVAQTGQTLLVQNTKTDPRFSNKVDNLSGFETQSVIAVPIKFRDQVFGVIELINCLNQKPFAEEDLFILETIADFAAICFVNAARYQDIVRLAECDTLTGAYNRTKLDKLCDSWAAKLHPQHLHVVLIDLNAFKPVNDTLGHAAGDKLLRDLSRLFIESLDDHDSFFRIGGDEFLLISPFDHDEPAHRAQLSKRLSHIQQQFSHTAGFSFGIANGTASQIKQLLETADHLMYVQKRDQSPHQ